MPRMSYKQQLNGLKAKIQIAKGQLGMADDAYRAMLERLTGKTSTTKMDMQELERVVKEMVAKGAKFTKPNGKRRNRATAPEGKEKKIQRIYQQLKNLDKPEAYAEGILRNQRKELRGTKTPCPLNMAEEQELSKVIAALDYAARRQGVQRK